MNTFQKLLLASAFAATLPLVARAEEEAKPVIDTTLCEQGQAQSPIALGKAEKRKDLPELVADYKEVELTLEYAPGLYAIHYPEGSTLTVGDKTYQLTRILFTTPAEHSMRGQKFDLEAQLEHKAADGSQAVVSILMRKGFDNFGLNTLVKKLPAAFTTEPTIIDGVFFGPQTLFPANMEYYRYTGSLSTPPCTEGVERFVLKSYVELGASQLAAFKKLLGNNARPQQPLNQRTILQN